VVKLQFFIWNVNSSSLNQDSFSPGVFYGRLQTVQADIRSAWNYNKCPSFHIPSNSLPVLPFSAM
jgi:hypothetical protein